MSVMVNGEDMCPHSAVCQTSPTSSSPPNANSDLDSDGTNINSAWAGIAVVIVVFVVALGVWYAIRRRRRARGGHNSVDAGGSGKRSQFGRAFGAFWRKSSAAKSPEQPIAVSGDMELVEDEEAKRQRPSSSATNLKRTATSRTLGTDESHATTLDTHLKGADEEARLYPMAETQRQSAEIPASALPEPLRDVPRTVRPSTPSSIRSSLSRLSIPPPGLGPPIHAQSPIAIPPPSHPPS